MTKEDLKLRTKKFNIAVINACELLPRNAVGFELANSLFVQQVRLVQITEQHVGPNQLRTLYTKLK